MSLNKKLMIPILCAVFLYCVAMFLWVFGVYMVGSTEQSYMVEWQFFSLCSSVWSLPIIVDYISVIFSCFVCLISGSVSLFSMSYMEGEVYMKRFMMLIMAFVGSMNLLIFVPSMITILLGWDGLGIVSFALVIYYQNKKSLAAGMLTVLVNRVGDALLILVICFLVNWGEWRIGYGMTGSYSMLVCFLVVMGAMTKSAQIPFSAWLPAAMAAPTPVSALVHSSTLVTAGVYLVIRFYSTLIESQEVLWFLSKMGVLTLLMAGLSACYEVDLKKIIALSTLSQLGLMMFTVGIGFPLVAVFHLLTHALFKALLFLCAGSIIHSTMDSQDGRILGSLNYLLPFSSSCLVLSSVALCGMPFLSGFYSKDLILEGAFSGFSGVLEIVIMLMGAGLSLIYSLRILLVGVFGQSYGGGLSMYETESGYVVCSICVLSIGAIMGGWLLQSVWVEVNGFSLVGVFGKLVISVVTFVGLFYSFVNFFLSKILSKKNPSGVSWFLSGMWFMNLASGSFLAGVGLKLGKTMHLCLDLGWMEVLGGQGVFSVLGSGVSLSYLTQKGSLLVYIRMFMVMLIFLMVCINVFY
uniref:NADH-ubiquinone oxidoreductase chain 5 n=1 Tax=Sinanodonta woodiana TaxID=1069815 RepID=F2WZA2_SINWO|nr:NADH dehydrogenase subunit 5 [Sinanodonta woodiana]ADP23800.1 NADH dehydrogenase subunit 5 [Sinanodonta woodiana]ADP23814.1 NADH dehydrogenase subunit 5 [Sinanodonta woodiana]ADP23828.1 NADH dehydrogenase subunit 5 [Sinanodonta woodiana]ADP23842.1 NADH dehydrogenase subunit 5 [Sinanodonta woodiana]